MKKEAVGPYELWSPVVDTERGFVLFMKNNNMESGKDKSPHYLKYDHVLKILRSDVEDPDEATKFIIKCQSKAIARRKLASSGRNEAKGKSPNEFETSSAFSPLYELDLMKRYMSWQDGRQLKSPNIVNGGSGGNKDELSDAASSGRLHSALLDRRSKMKSDKYCK